MSKWAIQRKLSDPALLEEVVQVYDQIKDRTTPAVLRVFERAMLGTQPMKQEYLEHIKRVNEARGR